MNQTITLEVKMVFHGTGAAIVTKQTTKVAEIPAGKSRQGSNVLFCFMSNIIYLYFT